MKATSNITGQKFNRLTAIMFNHMSILAWSKELDMSYGALKVRLRKGWSINEALTKPIRIWKR